MGFTKRQKVALIISLWLYFLWIVAICSIMRTDYKGRLIGCIITGGIGCAVVFVLFIIVFSGSYIIPQKIARKDNIQKIKSLYRTSNILAIYISIVGFFTLSLSVLLLDKHKIYSLRLAWLIAVVAVFAISLALLTIFSYRIITSSVRTFELQEKNDGIGRGEPSSDSENKIDG